MYKKIFSMLLSFSIILSLLVSCNNTTDSVKKFDDKYRNFYEIYVRSFSDSNGDHIGDLNGVISKLDYLKAADGTDDSKSLGIDGVWLMPIFTSPSQHKYDVTDYYSIDPTYGTMEDFENLLDKFHDRGIRVIIDLVLNHTSNEHPWFQQAVAALNEGKESKYIEYYNFTQEPEMDENDNVVGYSPVEDNSEGYYYESRFVSTMPDLNIANPDVIREIKDIIKFWIEKGVDGFRLDACKYYFYNDNVKNIEFLSTITQYCRSINPEFYLVGEVWDSDYIISEYYKSGIDSCFNFDCSYVGAYQGLFNNIETGNGEKLSERAEYWNTIIRNNNLNAIDAPFLSNHDTIRSASYFNDDTSNRKLAASLYMMLPGNTFIYYGEEIGMTQGWQNDSYKRLPIRWSTKETETNITPPKDSQNINAPFYSVEEQLEDTNSLLWHYKSLIKLKNQNPEIQRAQVVSACDIDNLNVAAYTCAYDNSSVMILHNITNTPKEINLKAAGYETYTILRGFVTASKYAAEEKYNAYMKDEEYEIPEFVSGATPLTYVNGVITIPPKTTVILKSTKSVDSTFITTTTTAYVTPSDTVTQTDTIAE
ncbi:MAG: alpha-amylase family glycosyl hydrolase [Firmicutes bacterium]|nr:alpha-amylase family glycosyl hydrolase [Bacillota bacterium]